MPLMPFLAATGFLAAILLVWGQLWVSTYAIEGVPATYYLGLAWTYLAVIVALAAFAWAGWSWSRARFEEDFQVTGWPVGLLVAALIMTGIDVGQSIVSAAIKIVGPFEAGSCILVSFTVIFIIGMSWAGTKNHWFWIAEIVVLIALGIVAVLAFLDNSFFFIQPLPN